MKVLRFGKDGGRQILVDLYREDDVFGETAFVGTAKSPESAVALEKTEVMFWTLAQIEALSMAKPQLAISLAKLFVHRTVTLVQRIESLATDGITQQLARALCYLSERLRTTKEDGSVYIMPVSHELPSQYIGTSREQVTQYMVLFRQLGYVQYTR